MRYLIEFLISTISSIGFGLVFSAPRKTLLTAGINGGIGWLIYRLILNITADIYLATFASSFFIASMSEVFARKFRYTASAFIFPGVINLCPGESVYNTMRYFVLNQTNEAIFSLYKSLAIAGAIAFGVLLASSFFSASLKVFRHRPAKRTDLKRR